MKRAPFARPLLAPSAIAALAWLALASHSRAQPAVPSDTLARVVPMSVVEVSTSRAGDRPAFAVTRLRRESLRELVWGQDTPIAIALQRSSRRCG